MTRQPQTSKNRRRKDRRRSYHDLVNALAVAPDNSETLRAMRDLKEEYFRSLDRQIDDLGAFDDSTADDDEKVFIAEIQQRMEGNGWVMVRTAEGENIQLRSDIYDYIVSRRTAGGPNRGPKSTAQRVAAAQSLYGRAVAGIRPRLPMR